MGEPEPLSQADQFRLSFIFAIDIHNREFEYFQYQSGSLDENTWQSYKYLILINHATKRGCIWWDTVGREIVNVEFAKMVDDMLAKTPENGTWEALGNWDQGLTKT
jgi:hypothetical protein